MSLKFLVAVLNWLQEEFTKVAEKHDLKAAAHAAQIKALQDAREIELQSIALAKKLASKIDKLLSE